MRNAESRIRLVLKTGSIVFALSAALLLALPGLFNSLLGLESNAPLEWAMRMIGLTLIALAGNMYSVSTRGSADSVKFSGRVMMVCAGALGVLTLVIPTSLNWFTIAYAAVGFGFSIAYVWAFSKKL